MKIEKFQKINRFLIIISPILIFFTWNRLPPQIPLFFGRPWGEDQLANKEFIFLLPIISTAVFLINNFLAKIYLKKEKRFFWATILISSLIVTTLNFISLIKIIMIII